MSGAHRQKQEKKTNVTSNFVIRHVYLADTRERYVPRYRLCDVDAIDLVLRKEYFPRASEDKVEATGLNAKGGEQAESSAWRVTKQVIEPRRNVSSKCPMSGLLSLEKAVPL